MMRAIAAALIAGVFVAPLPAAAEQMAITLSKDRVLINSNFIGEELMLFGAIAMFGLQTRVARNLAIGSALAVIAAIPEANATATPCSRPPRVSSKARRVTVPFVARVRAIPAEDEVWNNRFALHDLV